MFHIYLTKQNCESTNCCSHNLEIHAVKRGMFVYKVIPLFTTPYCKQRRHKGNVCRLFLGIQYNYPGLMSCFRYGNSQGNHEASPEMYASTSYVYVPIMLH